MLDRGSENFEGRQPHLVTGQILDVNYQTLASGRIFPQKQKQEKCFVIVFHGRSENSSSQRCKIYLENIYCLCTNKQVRWNII